MPAARRGGRGARGREEGRGVGGDGEGPLGSGSLMVSAGEDLQAGRMPALPCSTQGGVSE